MDPVGQKSAFRLELETIVAGRYLAHHPMYQAWAKGELSRKCMAGCMAESYHYVSKVYSVFFLIAAKAPADVINMELDNYGDEMNETNPHPALFLRFIQACGFDP